MIKPSVVALLPMKSNSERVRGKNFKNFRGRPLFSWVLDTLLSVQLIDLIVINTDARDTLASHGLIETDRISIRDRKPDICGDNVSMNRVIADDLSNVSAGIYLMTHTTNPLLSAVTIEKALTQFIHAKSSSAVDSLFTVDKVQTRFYRADASPVNHDPDNLIPTQELEPWYEENSNLYIFTRESFRATGARIGKRPMMFQSPFFESIDIDTPDDWDFAEVAVQYLQQKAVVPE